MAAKLVRAPNIPILIVAGSALLLLGAVGVEKALLNNNHYNGIVVQWLAEGPMVIAILGIALLYLALRRSRFAGIAAVIIATFLTFGVAFGIVMQLAVGRPRYVTWWTAIYLAIAGAIVWPSVFPWDQTANKPALFWMAVTFGTLTLLFIALAILVRI